MKKFLIAILGAAISYMPLFTSACECENECGFGWSADLDLTVGYRNDRIKTHVNGYNPPGTLVIQDRLKGKNLNIFEVGVEGRASICDDQLFVKGFADFGHIVSGHYKENVAFPIIVSEVIEAHVHRGCTQDYSIGAGYLFPIEIGCFLPCGSCLRIGPTAGYSYDYLKIRMRKVTTNDVPDPVLSDLEYSMRWHGPWAGVETEFCIDCFKVIFDYEFHWSEWRGIWALKGPDVLGVAFSDKRKSKHGTGNLFELDGIYEFNECWNFGIGLKYQFWQARKGHLVPRCGTFAEIGLSPTEKDKVPKATWQSAQIQLSAGYNF